MAHMEETQSSALTHSAFNAAPSSPYGQSKTAAMPPLRKAWTATDTPARRLTAQ
jgi:hypothetical protein